MRKSMLFWIRATLLGTAIAGVAAACGSSGGGGTTSGGMACTPGDQTACACPGNANIQGVHVCAMDGKSFGACDCGGTTSSSTGEGGSISVGTGMMDTCGDGIIQAGECDPTTETHTFCAKDCMDAGMGGGTSSGSSSGTGGSDPCKGHVYFAGMVPNIPSIWVSGGLTSFAAGDDMCQKANLGADHVCDYEEVLSADTNGEFSMIAVGTNVWIQRTTSAMVNGVPSAPGPGGRCNDWKYGTNHISDGEYGTFDMLGKITYHLDNDTFFDGVDTTHQIPNDLQCGGVNRAIMCCFKKCK
jgi:hypothetical protein